MRSNIVYKVKLHFELLCWIGFLCVLFFLPVNHSEQSLCLSRLLGFGQCPGCGLGHSMYYALHGRITDSFQSHCMGIPGLLIIFNRIYQLLQKQNLPYETKSHQSDPFH